MFSPGIRALCLPGPSGQPRFAPIASLGSAFNRSDFGLLNVTGKIAPVRISRIVPSLARVADSVFLDATKCADEAQDVV